MQGATLCDAKHQYVDALIKLAKIHNAKLLMLYVADEYYDTQNGPFVLPVEYDQ